MNAAEVERAALSRADATVCATIAVVVRIAVALWAAPRFPPAADGQYFHAIATRISEGQGYTWLWPDGAVTAAAHYPVGYPALLGVAYFLFGPFAGVAMALNAVFGASAALAVHRIATPFASRGGALAAGLAIALHPGLVLYTPALMTEGVSSALVALGAWSVVRSYRIASTPKDAVKGSLLAGCTLGLATLIRPQLLLLAPLFGAFAFRDATPRFRVQLGAVILTTCVALCLPWTVRNCVRMHSCSLVSVNAGWNLYIGAAEGANGSWRSVDELGVPPECRTVWDEAQKDVCFGAAGRREIAAHPLAYAALIPKKLGTTFDYAGAAGWYLNTSNSVAFDQQSKTILGVVETIWQRLLVAGALVALARTDGPNRRLRWVLCAAFGAFLFTRSGWIAYLGVVTLAPLLGRRLFSHLPAGLAAAAVFATALTHAIFFGAGRYSLLCFPLLASLAGCAFPRKKSPVLAEAQGEPLAPAPATTM
jgi:4-amino-4-deoxy-L-arabinose transferase-like glycosyltransferase